MTVEIWGGAWKNSPQSQYPRGFQYEGDMALEAIEVGATEWTSENEIAILLIGTRGRNSNLRQLYFRLPRDSANALARAILSSTESRLPRIRLQL
jgi:hypothetical protein